MRLAILFLGLAAACCSPATEVNVSEPVEPMRVVSLDYCADQYVLKFVDRSRILAVSPDAESTFSYMRDSAEGLPSVRPLAEDVLILKPDLIVRSYGGGPNASTFFERAGIPVVELGWTPTLESVMDNIERVAGELGADEKGREVTADMRSRLDALKASGAGQTAMYMTPAGVTTGPGSLVSELMTSAGYSNFEETSGWHAIPLEKLAFERPDVVAAAFFNEKRSHMNSWSATFHPVARDQLEHSNIISLRGEWTVCGGWFLLDAIEALAEGAEP